MCVCVYVCIITCYVVILAATSYAFRTDARHKQMYITAMHDYSHNLEHMPGDRNIRQAVANLLQDMGSTPYPNVKLIRYIGVAGVDSGVGNSPNIRGHGGRGSNSSNNPIEGLGLDHLVFSPLNSYNPINIPAARKSEKSSSRPAGPTSRITSYGKGYTLVYSGAGGSGYDASSGSDSGNNGRGSRTQLVLLTSLWAQQAPHVHRTEILAALVHNLHTGVFRRVHVVLDSITSSCNCSHLHNTVRQLAAKAEVTVNKTELKCLDRTKGQPTYYDLFAYSQDPLFMGKKDRNRSKGGTVMGKDIGRDAEKDMGENTVVILANADQVFDSSAKVLTRLSKRTLGVITTQVRTIVDIVDAVIDDAIFPS